MFQDEARFGRMVRIRRCWSPSPLRPVVDNGYQRQFIYVYGAGSRLQGQLDWMICPEMNTLKLGVASILDNSRRIVFANLVE
jgi:hypothetical protein